MAGVELDGIVGTHLVAAVTADAVFSVDLCGCFVENGDHMFWARITAGATGYTLGLDNPGEHRESIPEYRLYECKNTIMESWNCGW